MYADLLANERDDTLRQVVADLDALGAMGEPPAQVDAAIAQALRARSVGRASVGNGVIAGSAAPWPRGEALPEDDSPQPRINPWLQFAAGSIAILLVALLLVAVFRTLAGGGEEGAPGTGTESLARYEIIIPWSADGIAGNEKLYAVPVDGGEPRRLIPGAPDDSFREWDPDVAADGRVAFVSDRNGQPNLYVWQEGSAPRRITPTNLQGQAPRWSPDGTRIMFSAPGAGADIAQIWTVNADGSGLQQLTERSAGAVHAAWSPDGTRIAFTSLGAAVAVEGGYHSGMQVWIMHADGSEQRQATEIDPFAGSFTWLADGEHLLVTGMQAYIVQAETGEARALNPDLRIINSAGPAPFGPEIAVVSLTSDDNRAPTALLLVRVDGTEMRTLTHSADLLWRPVWSPDGRQIAFTRGVVPEFDTGPPPDLAADWALSVVDRDGGNERVLLEGVHRANRVVWRTAPAASTPVNAEQIVRDAFAPLSAEQERRSIFTVEAHVEHDSDFDIWDVELWERWTQDDTREQGMYLSEPDGTAIVHIALSGDPSVLGWEPPGFVFDVPVEFSLQGRTFGAALAAVNDPEAHGLYRETRDGLLVLHFEWQDHYAVEFNYVSRGEAWIDPASGQLQRIVHLIDRPESEPYPARTYTFRSIATLPAGSSPEGAYEIAGATRPEDLPAPDVVNPTPGGQLVYSKGSDFDEYDIYVANADGSSERRLTNSPGPDIGARWSPDGEHIVFVSYRDGNADLFVMDADGGNQRPLTRTPHDEEMPRWAPDGQRIAYTTYVGGRAMLRVIDVQGSRDVEVFAQEGSAVISQPVWSPDGTRIAFMSIGQPSGGVVHVVDAGGENLVRLTPLGMADRVQSWSPDSQRLLVQRVDLQSMAVQLVIAQADGSSWEALADHGLQALSAAWSPDGQHVAVLRPQANGDELIDMQLIVTDSGGAHLRTLPVPSGVKLPPVWSPDSQWIAVMVQTGDDFSLWLAAADGSTIRPLVEALGPLGSTIDWKQ
jgi:TolB protein